MLRALKKNYKKIIFVFLLFTAIVFNLTRLQLVAAGDISWFLNPFATDRRFVWRSFNQGIYYAINDLIPLISFFSFFRLFRLELRYIQSLYFLFFYLGAFASYYFLNKKLFPKTSWKVGFLVAFFYVINEYRLVSAFQDRESPMLISWPLVFYFYYQLLNTRKLKYVFLISLTSILYAGPTLNPPVVSVIYISLFFYLLYFLLTEKLRLKEYLRIAASHGLLAIVYPLANFWWLTTYIKSMLNVSSKVAETLAFRATGTGIFYDHFRLLGQWGWYTGHYLYRYAPFAVNYYKPVLLLTTYSIAVFSLLIFLKLRDKGYFEVRERKLYFFFGLLFFVGLFLANGDKHFFGAIFSAIYNSNQNFWIFREPWMKFTPIMVFSLPILLGGTLNYLYELARTRVGLPVGQEKTGSLEIEKEINFLKAIFTLLNFFRLKIKKLWYRLAVKIRIDLKFVNFVYFIVFACILINTYPLYTREVLWQKWNGSMRSWQPKEPEYWRDLRRFIERNGLSKERLLIFPRSFYGMAFNWPSGFSGFEPSTYFILNRIDSAVTSPYSYPDLAINKLFENIDNKNFDLKRYLGFLNIRYILQENDVDWRYTSSLPPSKSNQALLNLGFEKVAEFGKFTPDYLAKISNEEPKKDLHDELYRELTDQPALILYKIDDQYFLPHFYIPESVVFAEGDLQTLAESTGFAGSSKTGVYLNSQQKEIGKLRKEEVANSEIIEKAEEFFVKGEIKDEIDEKEVKRLIEPAETVFYPHQLYIDHWTWLYPLSLKKDSFDEWKSRDKPKELLQKKMYYSSKRLFEYAYAVQGNDYKRSNEALKLYKGEMEDGLKILRDLKKDKDEEFILYWTTFRGFFLRQKERVAYLSDRIEIRERTKEIFEEIGRGLDETEEKRNFSQLVYQFTLPQDGNYEIYYKDSKTDKNEWYKVGEKEFDEGINTLDLPVQTISENLLEGNLKIRDYQPSSIYKLSFNYKSEVPTTVFITEIGVGKILDKTLPPTVGQEENYSIFFLSTPKGEEASFFTFASEMSNAQIERVYQPQILLRRKVEKEKKETPTLTFQEINPTKFKVFISGARRSFPLVFSESYHPEWKVYLNKVQSSILRLRSGQEFKVQNLLNMFQRFWETSKPVKEGENIRIVPEAEHLIVNGQANSWFIDPEVLCKEGNFCRRNTEGFWDMELNVEFVPQRIFYQGIAISIVTLLGSLGYLISQYLKGRTKET